MKNVKSIAAYMAAKQAAQKSLAEVCPIKSAKRLAASKIQAIKDSAGLGGLSIADKKRIAKLEDELFIKVSPKKSKSTFGNRIEIPMYKRRSSKYAHISDALAAIKGI